MKVYTNGALRQKVLGINLEEDKMVFNEALNNTVSLIKFHIEKDMFDDYKMRLHVGELKLYGYGNEQIKDLIKNRLINEDAYFKEVIVEVTDNEYDSKLVNVKISYKHLRYLLKSSDVEQYYPLVDYLVSDLIFNGLNDGKSFVELPLQDLYSKFLSDDVQNDKYFRIHTIFATFTLLQNLGFKADIIYNEVQEVKPTRIIFDDVDKGLYVMRFDLTYMAIREHDNIVTSME